jgi:hypothetical protein
VQGDDHARRERQGPNSARQSKGKRPVSVSPGLRHCYISQASLGRTGGNMHSAGTRRRPEPASDRHLMASVGRHQATGGGRLRAALARHPRSALFGAGLGIAVVAGVLMMTLSGYSVRSGAGGCGLIVCGSSLRPSTPATTPHHKRPITSTTPGPDPSPVSQAASAAAANGPRRHPGSPAQHRAHGHPTHPPHTTPPSPSHPARSPRPTPTPTATATTGA